MTPLYYDFPKDIVSQGSLSSNQSSPRNFENPCLFISSVLPPRLTRPKLKVASQKFK